MSYNIFGNIYDPGFDELNELVSWVFDSNQYEVNGASSSHVSPTSSDNTIDFDFGQNEKFHWIDEDEIPVIINLGSHQNGYSSSDEFDQLSERFNEKFFWDDSKLSEVDDRKINQQFIWEDDIYSVDIFDLAFEKLSELFSGVDDFSGNYNTCWDRPVVGSVDVPLDSFSRTTNIGSVFEPYITIDDEFSRNDFSLSDGKLFDDVNEINDMLRQLTCVTDEPEYEEEKDLYLSCRKEAIKMDKAATCHLNEAKNSLLSGDHVTAKRLSQKAKEEKKAARKLHAEAAHEILKIKNKNNGIMKLDLHCLHVVEAIQAVKERLHKIETQGPDKLASGKLKRQRLEVITGRGKHSSGAPKLPAAVRSFLKKNGYQFDGSRPGVIMVQPKFRAD